MPTSDLFYFYAKYPKNTILNPPTMCQLKYF